MERLTKKDCKTLWPVVRPDCTVYSMTNRLAAIEDILGDNYDLDHLRKLARADRDGRCVVLPCKVGERLWCINSYGEVEETVAVGFLIENESVRICYREKTFLEYYNAPIGKVLFLNREAAEEALKGQS